MVYKTTQYIRISKTCQRCQHILELAKRINAVSAVKPTVLRL